MPNTVCRSVTWAWERRAAGPEQHSPCPPARRCGGMDLGINCNFHDTSAALVDGRGVCVGDERRGAVYPREARMGGLPGAGRPMLPGPGRHHLAGPRRGGGRVGHEPLRAVAQGGTTRLFADLFGHELPLAERPELVFVNYHLPTRRCRSTGRATRAPGTRHRGERGAGSGSASPSTRRAATAGSDCTATGRAPAHSAPCTRPLPGRSGSAGWRLGR
jgi:hypothetical protein